MCDARRGVFAVPHVHLAYLVRRMALGDLTGAYADSALDAPVAFSRAVRLRARTVCLPVIVFNFCCIKTTEYRIHESIVLMVLRWMLLPLELVVDESMAVE